MAERRAENLQIPFLKALVRRNSGLIPGNAVGWCVCFIQCKQTNFMRWFNIVRIQCVVDAHIICN